MKTCPPRWIGKEQLLFLIFLGLTLLATYRVLSLGIFMLDVGRTKHALEPATRAMKNKQLAEPFYAKHNCFTSYMVGAVLADEKANNLYRPEHYRNASHQTRIHKSVAGKLHVDGYPYPPPFLLLPMLFTHAGLDFFQARTAWFGINLLCFLITALALVSWLGEKGFSRFNLLIPAVLLAPPTLTTLQIGNIHFFLICISILAMLAFETRRPYLGGLLLAFAIFTKIFPALLLLHLLLRRRLGAVVWTLLSMLVLGLGFLYLAGANPYSAFFNYQVPRLLSGEAFSFAWKFPRALLANLSVMGTPYKLHQLGLLPGDPAGAARIAVWSYTAVLFLAVVWSGLKQRGPLAPKDSPGEGATERLWMARIWLAILILGELRNPFLPWGYGNIPAFWLLALLLPASGLFNLKTLGLLVIWGLFALNVPLPFGPLSEHWDLAYTLGATALCLAASLLLLVLAPRVTASADKRILKPRAAS